MAWFQSLDPELESAKNAVLADNWWVVALRGVLAILFGVVAFVAPVATMLALVLFFAAYCLRRRHPGRRAGRARRSQGRTLGMVPAERPARDRDRRHGGAVARHYRARLRLHDRGLGFAVRRPDARRRHQPQSQPRTLAAGVQCDRVAGLWPATARRSADRRPGAHLVGGGAGTGVRRNPDRPRLQAARTSGRACSNRHGGPRFKSRRPS